MRNFQWKRWLLALVVVVITAVVPRISQAGYLVLLENGAVKPDNSSLNKAFGDIIVGAANPTSSIYGVKDVTPPTQSGVTVNGSLSTTGDATVSTSSVALTDGQSLSFNVGLKANTVGVHSGNVVLHRTSGTQGTGSTTFRVGSTNYTDRDDTIHLQVKVLDHSDASFSHLSEQTKLTIDFGEVEHGQYSSPQFFDIWNRVTTANLTAGLVLTGITASGESSLFSMNLAPFSDPLYADNSLQFNAQFLAPSVLGLHTAHYVLHFSDQNLAGATTKDLELDLRGTAVAPEPSSIALGFCGLISLTGAGWWRRRRAAVRRPGSI